MTDLDPERASEIIDEMTDEDEIICPDCGETIMLQYSNTSLAVTIALERHVKTRHTRINETH